MFEKSEEYRKYLIEIRFGKDCGYTVWGTDMSDNEQDKLLTVDGKLVLFGELDNIKHQLKDIDHPFHDKESFKKWINEENLKEVYYSNDLVVLSEFSIKILRHKSEALKLLDCLNLIQDFFFQIEDVPGNLLLENPLIVDLKDYIYNNFFWKKQGKDRIPQEKKLQRIGEILDEILKIFHDKTTTV